MAATIIRPTSKYAILINATGQPGPGQIIALSMPTSFVGVQTLVWHTDNDSVATDHYLVVNGVVVAEKIGVSAPVSFTYDLTGATQVDVYSGAADACQSGIYCRLRVLTPAGAAAFSNNTLPQRQYLQTGTMTASPPVTGGSADLSGGQTFAVSLWYKMPVAPGAITTLISKGNGTVAGDDWAIQTTADNHILIYVSDGVNTHSFIFASIVTGAWQFVYASFDAAAGQFTAGVGGSSGPDGHTGYGSQATSNPLQIGMSGNFANQFIGSIDAVGFWDRQLTAGGGSEIAQLWNASAGKKIQDLTGSILTGMAAGWDLDGASFRNGLWLDSIKSHHLTAYGAVALVTGQT